MATFPGSHAQSSPFAETLFLILFLGRDHPPDLRYSSWCPDPWLTSPSPQPGRGLVHTLPPKRGALAKPPVLAAPAPLYGEGPTHPTGAQAPPGLLAEGIHSRNGPQFVSGVLSGAGYRVQTTLWW